MTARIALALAIHNHQPVGNFGWVFEDVFGKAYDPLLQALERHPGVHLSLHYTGPLIEWIRTEHPDFLGRLGALVERGQVEVLGGGYYEPVLVSLPERDRHGQLVRMADEVERLVGRRPRGAWLAERVWEPQLPSVLADAGYEWTILDDNHFRAASIAEDAMWGAYVTEDQGRLLRVFGTEQGLRYRIPFGSPEDVIAHLRGNATEDGRRLGMMGDDGEKFGAWPGTYEHCWSGNQWIDRFFRLLEENASWLETVTPSSWLDREPPVGRIYVPTASYLEMGEWALPPADSRTFTALVKTATEHDLPERRFLRGGFWRNFQARYREINDLHKQMLRVSAKVAAMAPGADRDAALDHLYRGQSNDCYWHGLFGGIYIVHMRLATYAHLIAAEDIADEARLVDGDPPVLAGGGPGAIGGTSLEAAVTGASVAWLAMERDGCRGAGRAHGARTRRRRARHRHGRGAGGIPGVGGAGRRGRSRRGRRNRLVGPARDPRRAGVRDAAPAGGIPRHAGGARTRRGHDSAGRCGPARGRRCRSCRERPEDDPRRGHDEGAGSEPAARVRPSRAAFRPAARGAGRHRSRGLPPAGRRGAWRHGRRCVPAGVAGGRRAGGRPRRTGGRTARARPEDPPTGRRTARPVALGRGRVPQPWRGPDLGRRGIEWNVDLAGGGGNPAAYYAVPVPGEPAGDAAAVTRAQGQVPGDPAAGVVRSAHDSSGRPGIVGWLAFGNTDEGADVRVTPTPPADVAWYPVETVSNSEAGFERQYQGSCLLLRWPLALDPGARATFQVRFDVSSSRDHRAEGR